MIIKPKPQTFLFLGFSILAALLAYFMYSINQFAPVQRDGSHFLFMANNIAQGQNPYWASFETKNPLVEYYWSLFFRAFEGDAHIIKLARAAEAIYLFITSLVVYVLARNALRAQSSNIKETQWFDRASFVAAVVAALGLFLMSSWRVTDTGFNIAEYQTLVEGVCLLLAFSLFKKPNYTKAIGLGVFAFSAWFVKQTSVISVGIPLLLLFLLHPHKKDILKYLLAAIAVSTSLLLLFFLNLAIEGTLANYNRSTFEFKSLIFSLSNSDFAITRFNNALNNAFSLSNPQQRFSSYLLLFFLIFPILLIIDIIVNRTTISYQANNKIKWVIYAWFIGSMIQACMGLTFYAHYFISSIVPALLSMVLFCSRRQPSLLFFGGGLILTTQLYWDYRKEEKTLNTMRESAPIYHSVKALSSIIPNDATVFNWSALSHFHVLTQKPSDYQQNMILPYVLIDVDEEKRTSMFQKTFNGSPPEYVIEFRETLPKFTPLRTFPLTVDHLKRWSGVDYIPLANFRPHRGRYDRPVFVFTRADIYEEALAKTKSVIQRK